MNKYIEALNELSYMLADNDNFYSAEERQTTYNVIKEAIEKYDEIINRIEELEKELVNPNRIVSIKPHSWGEYEERIEELELSCLYKDEEIRQLQANFDACKHLADKNVELHKRIEFLEQKNKVLVDFLNDMEIKFSSYGFFFVANRVPKDKAFEILDIIKPNSDYVKQLKKEMLELVEVEE